MFTLIKSDTIPLTAELAEKHCCLEASPTERVLTPSHTKYLRGQLVAGLGVSFNWAVAEFEGRTLRMNGQHSSAALSEMNGEFPGGLKVHLDTYRVDTKDDLTLLFRQFDSRKSSRTTADVAGAFQMNEPALRGIPRDIAKLTIDGVKWFRDNVVGAPTPSGDDAYQLFAEPGLLSYLLWTPEIFSIKTPEMKSPPVVGGMFATFRAGEAASRDFWNRVARGGGSFEDTAPETVLDSWLKLLKESPDEKKDKAIKAGNLYQGCIFAWNAFREGKTIKAIKYDVSKGYYDPI